MTRPHKKRNFLITHFFYKGISKVNAVLSLVCQHSKIKPPPIFKRSLAHKRQLNQMGD